MQDVRRPALDERAPLLDAKAVLLVHDGHGQVVQVDPRLDQRVRADEDARPRRTLPARFPTELVSSPTLTPSAEQ